MGKRKIRCPITLKDNTNVKTLEELRQFFDLDKIMEYYVDGSLAEWLRDRYEDDIANEVAELDKNASNIAELLCIALGVPTDNIANISVADVQARIEKKQRLKVSPAYGKNIGDIINFGKKVRYDDLNVGQNVGDELKWKIIDINEGKALLFSEYVVKCMQYLTQGSSWKESLVHDWLKNDFYNTAFTDAEKEFIFNEEIFILNREEVRKYLKNPEERIAYLNQDIQQIAMSPFKDVIDKSVNCVYWWLRDELDSKGFARVIDEMGVIQYLEVNYYFGVRPAMWISL